MKLKQICLAMGVVILSLVVNGQGGLYAYKDTPRPSQYVTKCNKLYQGYTWSSLGGDQFHMGHVLPLAKPADSQVPASRCWGPLPYYDWDTIPRTWPEHMRFKPTQEWKTFVGGAKKSVTEGCPVIDKAGYIYIINDSGDIYKVNSRKGKVEWVKQHDPVKKTGYLPGCPPAIGYAHAEGTLYVIKYQYDSQAKQNVHFLEALNLATGKHITQVLIPGYPNNSGPVCADKSDTPHQGRIYLGFNHYKDKKGRVFVYEDKKTAGGRMLDIAWTQADAIKADGKINSSVAVSFDGTAVYTTANHITYAVKPPGLTLDYTWMVQKAAAKNNLTGVPALGYGLTLVDVIKSSISRVAGIVTDLNDWNNLEICKKGWNLGDVCFTKGARTDATRELIGFNDGKRNPETTVMDITNSFLYYGTSDNQLKWRTLAPDSSGHFSTYNPILDLPLKPSGAVFKGRSGIVAKPIWVQTPRLVLQSGILEGWWSPMIYVATTNGYLHGLDLYQRPAELWKLPVGNKGPITSSPALTREGKIVVASSDGNLYCYGPTMPNRNSIPWPLFGNEIRGSRVSPYDSKIAKPYCKWRSNGLKTHEFLDLWSSPVIGKVDNKPAIYVMGMAKTGGAMLYCYDRQGKVLWHKRWMNEQMKSTSPALSSDGSKIFVCTKAKLGSDFYYSGILRCLNAGTGKELWSKKLAYYWKEAIPAVDCNDIVYIGGKRGQIHAFHSDGTPALHWPLRLPNTLEYVTGRIVFNGYDLYFTTDRGHICRVSQNGYQWPAKKYKDKPTMYSYYYPNHNKRVMSSPAVGRHNIYVVTDTNELLAIDPSGMTLSWRMPVKGNKSIKSEIIASPAVYNGTRFIGGSDEEIFVATKGDGTGTGYFYRFDGSNPKKPVERWSFALGAEGSYSSPAVSGDGAVYFGSSVKMKFYRVNPFQKTVQWTYQTTPLTSNIWSSPAIDKNGDVYFGATDGYLYCLGPKVSAISLTTGPGNTASTSLPASGPAGQAELMEWLIPYLSELQEEATAEFDPTARAELDLEIARWEREAVAAERDVLVAERDFGEEDETAPDWLIEELEVELVDRDKLIGELERGCDESKLFALEDKIFFLEGGFTDAGEDPIKITEIEIEITRHNIERKILIRNLDGEDEEFAAELEFLNRQLAELEERYSLIQIEDCERRRLELEDMLSGNISPEEEEEVRSELIDLEAELDYLR